MARAVLALIIATALTVVTASAEVASEQDRQKALRRYRTGQQLMSAEAWQKAALEFSAAAKLDPLLMLAHYGLGQASMKLKQYRAAIWAFLACREAFRQLVMLEASNGAMVERLRREELTELRDSLRQIKKPGARVAIENRISDLESPQQRDAPGRESRTPAEVSLALGSAYFRAGDIADAEREYREAIRVKPRFGEAHNNLAVVLMMGGHLAEAEHEVHLAEEAGFRVNAQFKDDLHARKQVARLK